jgi:tRNA 2-thiouridine synthesizing protein A
MNERTRNGDWRGALNLDLSGLKCPLPALLTAKALRGLKEGECLSVTVTDPLAPLDLKHLCQSGGHELMAVRHNENGARQLLIRCGPRG